MSIKVYIALSNLVELWRIELQSKNKFAIASTCLEKLFVSHLASHNLQSYTRPASRVHPKWRHTQNISK